MRKAGLTIVAIILFWQVASAQTTAFTYQGSLKSSGAPANGNYDFEFRLRDSESGSTIYGFLTLSGVVVTNGIFAVTLDFGNQYPDPSFIEVRVRPTGGGVFTTLTPRERITAVPYAVKSLNAEQLGGVAANQYVTTTTGGTNFIQNTTTYQASSNFNVSGTGTANILNAGTRFELGGNRILGMGANGSLFAGFGAGAANFGGSWNAFFGTKAGISNTTGNSNAFFGMDAGGSSTTGSSNAFFGNATGFFNTTGFDNTFVGMNAGNSNTTGNGNTVIGRSANVGANNLTNATAIGASAVVSQSDSLVLGNGVNVGIGTSTPGYKLHVVGENIRVEGNTTSIFPRFSLNFTGGGTDAKKWQNYASTDRLRFTALNDAENSENIWLDVVRSGTNVTGVNFLSGVVSINQLGSAGTVGLCRNVSNQISTCSSSARYKKDVASYKSGLSLIKQLRPVSFNWKSGDMPDLGLVAEEVADVEPLLTTTNDKGEVEGVKYDRIGVIAVNAIKEQQTEISELQAVSSEQAKKIEEQRSAISRQQSVIELQQKQIDEFKKIVCSLKPDAEVCK